MLKLRKMFLRKNVSCNIVSHLLTFFAFSTFSYHRASFIWGMRPMCELFKHGIDTFFAAFSHGSGIIYPLKSRYPNAHIHTSRTHNCLHAFKSTLALIFAGITFYIAYLFTSHFTVQYYITVRSSFLSFFLFSLTLLYNFRYYILLKFYSMLFDYSASIPKYLIARMIFYCCHQPLIVCVV